MIAFMDSNNNNTHSSQELIPPSTEQQNASVDTLFKPKSIKNRQSNSTVSTHRIGDWTIRESLAPFSQKENKSSSIKHEQQVVSNKSNVLQWNIDDVCVFFEHVLGENCYTPIIQEHLIDGIALLLLKEEHLTKFFRMQSKSRIKLLNRINKLKTGDLSAI